MIFMSAFSLTNAFSQKGDVYFAGTPQCYEKLEVSLEVLIEGDRITAVLDCKNNTGFDIYVPDHYINIFDDHEEERMATNNYFLVYNQHNEIAEYFGFGTKYGHSIKHSILLKNGDSLTITIDHLEKIYCIPKGTTTLFVSYYSTIAPPSNTVQVGYINN